MEKFKQLFNDIGDAFYNIFNINKFAVEINNLNHISAVQRLGISEVLKYMFSLEKRIESLENPVPKTSPLVGSISFDEKSTASKKRGRPAGSKNKPKSVKAPKK